MARPFLAHDLIGPAHGVCPVFAQRPGISCVAVGYRARCFPSAALHSAASSPRRSHRVLPRESKAYEVPHLLTAGLAGRLRHRRNRSSPCVANEDEASRATMGARPPRRMAYLRAAYRTAGPFDFHRYEFHRAIHNALAAPQAANTNTPLPNASRRVKQVSRLSPISPLNRAVLASKRACTPRPPSTCVGTQCEQPRLYRLAIEKQHQAIAIVPFPTPFF